MRTLISERYHYSQIDTFTESKLYLVFSIKLCCVEGYSKCLNVFKTCVTENELLSISLISSEVSFCFVRMHLFSDDGYTLVLGSIVMRKCSTLLIQECNKHNILGVVCTPLYKLA